MDHDDRSFDENEWTPGERAQLDALMGERVPPPALKHRTLAALERNGALRRRRSVSLGLAAGLLLAASLVFGAGAVVGYSAAERRATTRASEPSVPIREVARADSAATGSTPTRHVVWF